MQYGQVKRRQLEVVIYTQSYKIVGTIHIIPANRLVDHLNSKTGDIFIVVTDANIYTLPKEKLLHTADFFAINKNAIMMVFPKPPVTPSVSDEGSKDAAS